MPVFNITCATHWADSETVVELVARVEAPNPKKALMSFADGKVAKRSEIIKGYPKGVMAYTIDGWSATREDADDRLLFVREGGFGPEYLRPDDPRFTRVNAADLRNGDPLNRRETREATENTETTSTDEAPPEFLDGLAQLIAESMVAKMQQAAEEAARQGELTAWDVDGLVHDAARPTIGETLASNGYRADDAAIDRVARSVRERISLYTTDDPDKTVRPD